VLRSGEEACANGREPPRRDRYL